MSITTGDGKTYRTIGDVCRRDFGVSEKTLRSWIRSGFIEEPPTFRFGRRTLHYFPVEYVERTKKKIGRSPRKSA